MDDQNQTDLKVRLEEGINFKNFVSPCHRTTTLTIPILIGYGEKLQCCAIGLFKNKLSWASQSKSMDPNKKLEIALETVEEMIIFQMKSFITVRKTFFT